MEKISGQEGVGSMGRVYAKRGVTCERQVLREEIDNPMDIPILPDRGLDCFFN